MNASQLLVQGASNQIMDNWEPIGLPDNELLEQEFQIYMNLISSVLWIDPTETGEDYDFGNAFLGLKVRMHVDLTWDSETRVPRIYEAHFHHVDLYTKEGGKIDLTNDQYTRLIKAIEGKLRLRPIVETDY